MNKRAVFKGVLLFLVLSTSIYGYFIYPRVSSVDPVNQFWEKFSKENYKVRTEYAGGVYDFYFERGELVKSDLDPHTEGYVLIKDDQVYILRPDKTYIVVSASDKRGQTLIIGGNYGSVIAHLFQQARSRELNWFKTGSTYVNTDQMDFREVSGGMVPAEVKVKLDSNQFIESVSIQTEEYLEEISFSYDLISDTETEKEILTGYRRVEIPE